MIPKYFTPPKEAVKVFPDGREICDRSTVGGRREYDNRKEDMWLRQNECCAICKRWLPLGEAQFDHEHSRGGGKQDDRIMISGEWHNAVLCGPDNYQKGSRPYKWRDGEYVPV